MTRRIMHIDMDAFYASVEQVDHPELRGKPVIVGGAERGVVAAASYEARKYGVHSAMPVFQARRLCPHGIFLPVRMKRYKEASCGVMEILSQVSPLVEQVSIDEAYLDISGDLSVQAPAEVLARSIKQKVFDRFSLTCSTGVAPNKFLAKVASDVKKPDGLTIIEEADVTAFLHKLPVSKIPGVGAKTAQLLRSFGVTVASDVLKLPLTFWTRRLGKFGVRLYEKAQGIDTSPVAPHSEPKSISAESTFPSDTDDIEELLKWLLLQAEDVGRNLRAHGYRGKTVTLKIKFSDFRQLTRSRTLHESTSSTQVIFDTAAKLLISIDLSGRVRLIGVGVSNLDSGPQQIRLFLETPPKTQEKLDQAMDDIYRRFGGKALKRGRIFDFE